MNNRRHFIKKAGLGFGFVAASGNALPYLKAGRSNEIFINDKKELKDITVKVTKPLFCPYYSINTPKEKGGNSYYYRSDAFTHNPFTVSASGMSGSPVIIDADGRFIGFMTTNGYELSTFSFDGNETLTVSFPEGQELYLDESGSKEAWKDYNKVMMKRLNFEPLKDYPDFWSNIEYCTWVEQKYQASKKFEHFHLLTHDFVKKYLDKIIEYGYPKGKMTLDHGWGMFPDGSINSGFGSWQPDPKKFPNFRKTIEMIQKKGFTPGLWIGFPKIHHTSISAKKYPELLGSFRALGKDAYNKDIQWLNPKADIFEYASETINRFYEMGVMKFKIDMSYNTKSDMLHIHKELYRAAKLIDKNIEMEFHVPDIFFTKYADVIRTNDIWINDKFDWRSRVKTHYEISYNSSPGRGINLDHIGGNDTTVNEHKFLEHLSLYKNKTGYPLISLLPHHLGEKCVNETGEYLWGYENGTKSFISNSF